MSEGGNTMAGVSVSTTAGRGTSPCTEKPWRKPTMPIDSPSGTIVLYHGTFDEQVRFGGSDDPRPLCKKRVRYTVDHTEIHSWHTKVYLREVKGAFPAGAFHLAPVRGDK